MASQPQQSGKGAAPAKHPQNPQKGPQNRPKAPPNPNPNKHVKTNAGPGGKPCPSAPKRFPPNGPQSKGPARTDAPKRSEVLTEVMSTLECPVCAECMQSPIFMCETGHNLCNKCRLNLCVPICPLCKCMMTEQRNFGLEAIASKMCVPCPNASKGCPAMTTAEKTKAHLKECKHDFVDCPMGEALKLCSWKGPKEHLYEHFSQMHAQNSLLKFGSQVAFNDFDVRKNDYNLQLLRLHNELFLYHVKIDVYKNVALWAVQYVGTESDAADWSYEFDIYVPKMTKKVMKITEACFSSDVSIDAIFNSGKCVAVPLFILQNYVAENEGRLTFKFFVRNPKQGYNIIKKFPGMTAMAEALNEVGSATNDFPF